MNFKNFITESSTTPLNEASFRLVLDWFKAPSGSARKGLAGDRIKAKLPGVEPWKWDDVDLKP